MLHLNIIGNIYKYKDPSYKTHDIEYFACILHIQENNIHDFSIFCNIISIL